MVWSALAHLFTVLLALIGSRRRSDQDKAPELLILQHQPNIVARKQRNPIRATRPDKLTHLLIFSRAHLHRVLNEFVAYYNTRRPHQGLQQ